MHCFTIIYWYKINHILFINYICNITENLYNKYWLLDRFEVYGENDFTSRYKIETH